MASLIKQLKRISNYTGIFLKDKEGIFVSHKTVTTAELQKRIKAPYTIVVRFYNQGKSTYIQHHITNNLSTIKKICDEISAEREINQINKTFSSHKTKTKSLTEVFIDYLAIQKPLISPKHYKNSIYFYNSRIDPYIGKKRINEITEAQLQKIVNKYLAEGYKPRSAKTFKDLLSPIFEYAIKNKYCSSNPAKELKIPKFDNQKYFTISEENAQKLYQTILNYENKTIRAIFIFLAHGRRKNEVLNLTWENINFDQGYYTLGYNENKSKRNLVFPLSNLQVATLLELGPKKSGYIFTQKNGHKFKDIRWHWDKIRAELDFPIVLHDLRHIIGYFSVNNNIPLELVAKTLGHSNIQVTQRYSNVSMKNITSTLDTVFNIFDKKKNE